MLAASPMRAADPSLPSPPEPGKALVVRVDPRSGRLVRSVVLSSRSPFRGLAPRPSSEIREIVDRTAKAHDVDPLLVHSIIKVESNYDPHAISPKGAEGLMQLMPSTARMLGVTNSFDPGQNIEAGVTYLRYLQSVYKDDRLALAAYNAGPGAVEKYKWIPPYRETQNYVNQVGKHYQEARQAAESQAPAKAPVASAQPASTEPVSEVVEEKHPQLEQFVDENGKLHLRTVQ
jgi:soluble lytic murein transglycosylase-like protein